MLKPERGRERYVDVSFYKLFQEICLSTMSFFNFFLIVLFLQITRQHGYILSTDKFVTWSRSRYFWCGEGYIHGVEEDTNIVLCMCASS